MLHILMEVLVQQERKMQMLNRPTKFQFQVHMLNLHLIASVNSEQMYLK